jgi:hypothetical protein
LRSPDAVVALEQLVGLELRNRVLDHLGKQLRVGKAKTRFEQIAESFGEQLEKGVRAAASADRVLLRGLQDEILKQFSGPGLVLETAVKDLLGGEAAVEGRQCTDCNASRGVG